MKLLTKLGGLVAVAAVILAGASLLVSPTPVHAAQDNACTAAGSAILSNSDGTAGGGAAITQVASGSTTTVHVLVDDPSASGQVVEASVSTGTLNGSTTAAVISVDTGVAGAGGCTNAGLATGDTVGAANDEYAKFTFVAPTVASDTIVTVNVKVQGAAAGFGAVTVKAAVTPDSLTLGTPTNTAIPATSVGADPGDAADVTATLKEGTTALNGQTITVITTSGLLESDGAGACVADANDTIANGVQACTATTAGAGQATVSLFGAGASGTATLTFVKGSLSASVDITLFGAASAASGSLTAGTVQATNTAPANRTFAVIKVTDNSGNPVPGTTAVGTASGITVDNAAANKPAGTTDCTAGTNSKGECYIELTTSSTTTLGDKTLDVNVAGITGTKNVTLTIKVVGTAASVSSDAPASVAANSQTEITATGADSNGDAVGAGVATTATIIEGSGGLLNVDAATGNAGEQKFTFVAPSQSGTTTILVTIGSASQLITVSIGAAAPTPGAGFADALSDGVNLTTYGGGTVAQLGTDAADAGATSVSVTVEGAWVIYVVGAPSFVNQAFNDQFPDGVPAGQVVLVLK